MEYEVVIDFGDNAVCTPKRVKNLTELGLYLERIPGMIGFEIHHEAKVKIKMVPARRLNLAS